MVDFTVSEEIKIIVRGLRSFLEKEIKPLEEKYAAYLEDERRRLQDDGSLVPELKEVIDEAQRKKYLVPLTRGEQTTCFALTEPEAGSDIKNLKTKAEKHGDYYILNGMKTFITNATYADFAQVFAVTDPDTSRS